MSHKIISTGLSGTIGRHLSTTSVALPIRLDEEFQIDQKLLMGSTVLHLAAIVGEKNVCDDLNRSYQVNVKGAVNLARIVKNSSAKKFVFVSTSHVYQVDSQTIKLDEDSPTLPRGHYPLQKLLAEELISDVFKDEPSRLLIARVFSVLDQGQPPGTLGHSIESLLSDETRELAFVDDKRDFLSPKVISKVLIALAESNDCFGYANICSGIGTTVQDAVRLLIGEVKFKQVANRLKSGHSSTHEIVGHTKRLEDLSGLSASRLFTESVQEWDATIRNSQ